MIFNYNNVSIEYQLSETNCSVKDGYKISSKEIMRVFVEYLVMIPGFDARSVKSYIDEWRAHNLLYSWGIFKSRTRDTDLNYNESLFRRFGYFFLSKLYNPNKNLV